jgi:hypothetical protein
MCFAEMVVALLGHLWPLHRLRRPSACGATRASIVYLIERMVA